MVVFEHSINVLTGGQSSRITLSAVSAQSATFTFEAALAGYVLITPDVNCWIRQGTNPTALADGTDQILLANNTYRAWVNSGNKIAAIAGGAGNMYFTPGG